MDFTIKTKQSLFSFILKFVIIFLLISAIICFVLAFLDLRSEEQKLKDKRDEILSKPYAEETIEVIGYVYLRYGPSTTINYVTFIRGSSYTNVGTNNGFNIYYDRKTNTPINENEWVIKMSNSLSYDIYVGNNVSSVITIKGDELSSILEVYKNGIN